MEVPKELLNQYLVRYLRDNIGLFTEKLDMDIPAIVQSRAVQALEEIRAAVRRNDDFYDNAGDFNTIEEILHIFDKYGLHSGDCHDFG
ncbi:MAG: hypothetical protein HFI90_11320 [Clostridia bacterium]|nr:hypothetical protein [Clostridia bacterium]